MRAGAKGWLLKDVSLERLTGAIRTLAEGGTCIDPAFPDALAYLNSMLTLNLQAEDVAEGVGAFLQKRKPEWKGR